MNIFVTSTDPVKSARYLDDQRLIKMISESTQLLSTACFYIGTWQEGMPRKTHDNHPCNVWTRERRDNFDWLYDHALALQDEWRLRYGHNRTHAMLERFNKGKGYKARRRLQSGATPFVNCAANQSLGIDYKHIPDVCKAYRKYLKARWMIQSKLQGEGKRAACCTICF